MKYNLIEQNDEYLHYEITGKYSLDKGEKIIEKIHDQCVEKKINKLLLDITKKEGVIPTMDRFDLGELIAKLFPYKIKFAVIAQKDQIDKFSETVAFNRGARLMIFSDKTEALEWLLK
jgi:hypothetical protein